MKKIPPVETKFPDNGVVPLKFHKVEKKDPEIHLPKKVKKYKPKKK